MHIHLLVRNQNISLKAKRHAIKIVNDEPLIALLAKDAEKATEEFISCFKAEYLKLFNCGFEVSDASIAVEIWGHVYAEKFGEAVKSISPFELIDSIAQKIIMHAEEINIGEKGHDHNRFIWDALAPFKSVIADVLFFGKK